MIAQLFDKKFVYENLFIIFINIIPLYSIYKYTAYVFPPFAYLEAAVLLVVVVINGVNLLTRIIEINFPSIAFIVLIICGYVGTLIIDINRSEYLFGDFFDITPNNLFYGIFLYCVPCFVFLIQSKNFDVLLGNLKVLSYVIVILLGVFHIYLVFIQQNAVVQGMYMTFSYNMLTPLCVITLIDEKDFKRNFARRLIMIAGIVLILLFGARGALVSYFLVLGLKILFVTKKQITGIQFCGFNAFLLVILLIYNKILDAIMSVAVGSGGLYRTIELMMAGRFIAFSGRENIVVALLSEIRDKYLFIGGGLFVDRDITSRELGVAMYSHNILIESMATFGVIIGIILFIWFTVMLIKCLFKGNDNVKLFTIIFMSQGYFKLLISGSFVIEPMFYALLGMIYLSKKYRYDLPSYIHMKRERIKLNKNENRHLKQN